MTQRSNARIRIPGQFLVLALTFVLADVALAQRGANSPPVSQAVREQLQQRDTARVIVKLRMPTVQRAEGRLDRAAKRAQRRGIADRQGQFINRLRGRGLRVVHRFRTVPYVALEVDAAALARLEAAGLEVERIAADRLAKPLLADSVPIVEGDLALSSGLDGAGLAIAIIDTGIDGDHEFLTGAVIDEACFASGEGIPGDCPNGQAVQIGAGAGVPCFYAPDACRHGTHVAGIAAGDGPNFTGVAPGADLIAIQVFHSTTFCAIFEESPCARAYFSDVAAGLEHVVDLAAQYDIAAVNLSLGAATASTGACDADDPQMAAVMDNIVSLGIAPVVASGNGGYAGGIDFPSCLSSAISVGATTKDDQVAWYSNVSEEMDVFAPGDLITSSVPGNQYAVFGGTSMAAPHVAGAFAILREAAPGQSVADMLANLVNTGRPVTDDRGATPLTKPRIRIGAALGFEAPLPVIGAITPDTVIAWRTDSSFTITGSGFIRASAIHVDGIPVPTTFVSSGELAGQLSTAALQTQATLASVSVVTPPPGGGTSNSVPLNIVQPQLTVDQTDVQAGADLTVTVSNNPGDRWGWIALYEVAQPDNVYVEFAYLGEDVIDTSWTVTAPATPGDYEFRLFLDNDFTRIANSGVVTVAGGAPPPPPPDPGQASLAVDVTTASAGDSITVTLTDGPGGASDWLALAAVGAADSVYVQYVYVGAGVTDTTWTVPAPSVAGQYEFRLFLNNGYERGATSAAVLIADPPPPPPDPNGPSLQPSAPTVTSGAPLTVTLTGGPGGANDWIALAEVGAADTSYVAYTYIGAGVSEFTWTLAAPAAPGQYEFRLFLDNGYDRAATSDVVVVEAAPPPEPDETTLDVDVVAVLPGEPVTLTVTDAPGGANDWLSFAATDAPDSSYVAWTFVGNGVTDTTWTVNAPAAPGDYEFRLFLDNGYQRVATSVTITVGAPPPDPEEPALTVDTPTAVVGQSVTMSLTNAPGGATDWLALAAVGAPDSSYVQYTYVGAGVTDTTWTVAMPTTPGDYEFRLFLNNGYERAGSSPVVTVVP